MPFPAFLDTCVLYGATLNDTLLRIADEGAFTPHWSEEILAELGRALQTSAGLTGDASTRRIAAMRAAFPEALVEGYEPLVAGLGCHEKDRHVLAAAVRSDSQVLVTFNQRDFPAEATAPFTLEVVHPDEFLLDQLDLHPGKVGRALMGQVNDATRPALTIPDLYGALSRAGVPKFVAEAQRHEFDIMSREVRPQ